MKAMSMVVSLLIMLVIAVVVLGLLTMFFLNQGGGAMDTAEAQRIFNTQCPNVDPAECSQFATTYKDLKKACLTLFPGENAIGECMVKCDCYMCGENICPEVKDIGYDTKPKARAAVIYEHVPGN